MKNIKGTTSLAGKNVQNSESIGNLTADTIRANTVISTNATITNLNNVELQTATSDIATLQTSKQDVITETTNIQLAELEVNDKIKFQFGTTDDEKTLIERGDAQGKLKFTANNVFFHDDDDVEMFAIKNNGNLNCFDNSIDNVADIDFNGSSLITQLSNKQDTITAGDGLSFTGATLNAEVTQAELDAKQDTITAGDGLSFTGATLNAEVTQFELDQKQDVLTAGNGIDITAGLGTTISVDEAELTTKQDLITDSTDIGLNELEVNDTIYFQRSGSSDTKTNITRSTTGGKMRLNADGYVFKDETNGNNLLVISDSGTCTTTSVQADFFSSITDVELDTLDGVTSNVQTQIDGKQDTITSSTSISCADINCNTNSLSGVTSITCQSIELHNGTSNLSFLDFGQGDFRFRQLYNQSANTFTFTIDDATGANPESKMVISRTEVEIENASLNLNSNDITNGGNGAFATLTLNGNDVEDAIDGKADDFALNLPLELDTGAFPDPAIKLNYNTDQFKLTGSNLELNRNIVECKTTNFNLSSSGNWGSTTTTYPYISGWGSITTLSGTNFLSNASNGIFSIDDDALYKIVVTVAGENVAVNNRVILAVYLSIDDADTSFRTIPAEFMLTYLRDDNFAVGGSSEFTVYKTLTTSNTLRLKTRIGTGSDNRDYNDQTDDANLNVYTSIIFEKIG